MELTKSESVLDEYIGPTQQDESSSRKKKERRSSRRGSHSYLKGAERRGSRTGIHGVRRGSGLYASSDESAGSARGEGDSHGDSRMDRRRSRRYSKAASIPNYILDQDDSSPDWGNDDDDSSRKKAGRRESHKFVRSGSGLSVQSDAERSAERSSRRKGKLDSSRSLATPPYPTKYGVIPGLLMGDLWCSEGKVVHEAIRQLADIAGVDEEDMDDREIIQVMGGPCTIVAVMMKWHRSIVITIDGLRALANLGSNSEFRDTAFCCGGVDVILTAMKNFQDDLYVQRNACAAICRFCNDMDENAVEFVKEYNGVNYLVHAMSRFPHNITLVEYAVSIVYTLNSIEQLRYHLLESGIASSIAEIADVLKGQDEHRETWMKARVILNSLDD